MHLLEQQSKSRQIERLFEIKLIRRSIICESRKWHCHWAVQPRLDRSSNNELGQPRNQGCWADGPSENIVCAAHVQTSVRKLLFAFARKNHNACNPQTDQPQRAWLRYEVGGSENHAGGGQQTCGRGTNKLTDRFHHYSFLSQKYPSTAAEL